MPEAENTAVSDQAVFNPYHKWLGIPPAEQPPHYYRLLGIDAFESDSDVILSAVDQRVSYLRQCALGPQGAASQKLLNEVSSAQVCLLDAQKKAAYDDQLRAKLQAAGTRGGNGQAAGSGDGKATARKKSSQGKGTVGALADQKAKVQQLVASHQYAAAVKALEKMAAVQGAAAAKYAQWAQKQLPLIKARPKKLKEESAAAVRLAKGMMQKHEYGPAAELLQQVPERFRSEEAQRLIERAIDLQEEVDLLIADMDDAIERNEYEGLQPNIERLLELKPGHRRARELYDDLTLYGGAGLAVRRGDGPPIVTGGKAAGLPWGVVAGIFVAAFSLTTLAVVFYLKSNGKTIRIEIDDPTAQVMVDGDVITITGNAGEVKLEPGQHELKVTRGDTVVQTRNFEVHKEKNPILKITLLDSGEDPTDVASNTPADPVPEDPPTTEPTDPPAASGAAGIAGVVIPGHTLGFGVLTMGETFRDPKKKITQVDPGLVGLPFAKPDVGSGELTFNVTSDGNVRLAMIDDWGKGGNSTGGWLERVIPREDFLAAGWKPIGAIQTGDGAVKFTVFERPSKAGETFTYRNHKYVAPILIGTAANAGTSPAPATTAGMDLTSVPVVCGHLESKRGATDAVANALVFDAPRGDGRSGASGLLLPPPANWDSRGTVWSCQFSRNGSSRGIIFIHPHGNGQVIVTVRQKSLHLVSPDQWPTAKPYEPGRSVIPLTLSADFADVFQLGDQTRELVSRLQADGTYEFLIDGEVVASASISDVKPLSFGTGVQFKGSSMPDPVQGHGGVIIGPTDGGSAKADQIRFGAVPAS